MYSLGKAYWQLSKPCPISQTVVAKGSTLATTNRLFYLELQMKDLAPNAVSMTSREIAELTGKQHKHVLRDIDDVLKVLSPELGLGFKSSTYVDSTGKSNRQFELDKDSTICLIAGYDANARMRIIKRWQELETIVATATQNTLEWQEARKQGIEQRKAYTQTLTAHNVAGSGYARCTNAVYQGTLNMEAKDIRKERGLKPKANARASLTSSELMVVGMAEMAATFEIEEGNLTGNTQCSVASHDTAKKLRDALPRGLLERERVKASKVRLLS
jgi:Rha family phage regulatory protein